MKMRNACYETMKVGRRVVNDKPPVRRFHNADGDSAEITADEAKSLRAPLPPISIDVAENDGQVVGVGVILVGFILLLGIASMALWFFWAPPFDQQMHRAVEQSGSSPGS